MIEFTIRVTNGSDRDVRVCQGGITFDGSMAIMHGPLFPVEALCQASVASIGGDTITLIGKNWKQQNETWVCTARKLTTG